MLLTCSNSADDNLSQILQRACLPALESSEPLTSRHRLKNPFTMSKKRANPAMIAAFARRLNSETVVFISGVNCWHTVSQAPSLAVGNFAGNSPPDGFYFRKNGGAYRDRTDDPLLAKQVLSQLS